MMRREAPDAFLLDRMATARNGALDEAKA